MIRLALPMLVLLSVVAVPGRGDDGTVPDEFAPFEHLIGAWKGQGIPQANRVKGWPERHLWAWKFQKGQVIGLNVELEGDHTLAKGTLGYDSKAQRYRLAGTAPDGKPVAFAGPIDAKGQVLVLDREGEPAEPRRLTLRLNSNKIRYNLWLESKPRGAPRFKKIIDVNLGKEGESFASGGSAQDLPKCVVTGGAALAERELPGEDLSVVLLRLPRRVQREPREIRPQGPASRPEIGRGEVRRQARPVPLSSRRR